MDSPSRRRQPSAIVLREATALGALRDSWERLVREAASIPMQGFAWSEVSASTVDHAHELRVVVVGGLHEPSAIAPLVRCGRELQLLGAQLGEPSDLLYADERALAELAAAIADLRTPVLLRRLPAGSPTVAALVAAFRPMGIVATRPASAHPVIALGDGWTAPEGSLTRARASDVRRARRRAEALGAVDVELLEPAPAELDGLLDEAYAIEQRSWKGPAGTALALDAPRGAFHRRYAQASVERRELRVAFLRIAGVRVAMQISLEWQNRLWLLKIGHDEAFAGCSPGTLLMMDVVRDAARRGLDAVQFLGDVAPWTAMWTSSVEPCVTVRAYPPAAASLIALANDAGIVARRRIAAWRRATEAGPRP